MSDAQDGYVRNHIGFHEIDGMIHLAERHPRGRCRPGARFSRGVPVTPLGVARFTRPAAQTRARHHGRSRPASRRRAMRRGRGSATRAGGGRDPDPEPTGSTRVPLQAVK